MPILQLKYRTVWVLLALLSSALLLRCAPMPPAIATRPPTLLPPIQEPSILGGEITPTFLVPSSTPLPQATIAQTGPGATATRASSVITIAAPTGPTAAPSPKPTAYTAFDFLSDYLTNRTYSHMLDVKPWTNSTLNVGQYKEELGGVTYWDFFSEPENWDSPFFMWEDDSGTWRPYEKQTVRDASGRDTTGYVLLERTGPGAMDKLWFAEDAVWMLTTPQSIRDVGPIENMDDFVEWGDLEKLGNLRLEVDDKVAYDGPIRDWMSGKAWGLTPRLQQALTWRHREYGSSGTLLPVLYAKRLKATLYAGSKKPKWFLATGVRLPNGTRVQPYTGASNDLPIAEMDRLAANVLEPETYIRTQGDVRAFDLTVAPASAAAIQFKGAGTVTAFQLRVTDKDDARQLWLRIKNGQDLAASLPLIAFFGDQKALTAHRSTPLGILEQADGYLFYCNLPLPFQNGLTIELTTNSAAPIDVAAQFALTLETANTQLWVQYRPGEKLSMFGPDYAVRIPGSGKLVGLVLATEEQDLDRIPIVHVAGKPDQEDPVKRPWPMGYLEGNLTLRDGAGNSRIYTGHEDWADASFYFNRGYTSPPGGSNRPFGGLLRYLDGKDGYATIFRYFNDLSAFRFKDGLTMLLGHGTWNNNYAVRYGTTVYYYREPGP